MFHCFWWPGVIFKLDKDSLHESLRLARGNLTVKQTSMVHANAFGTAFLADGRHFWTVNVDSLKGENSFIAVGEVLSCKALRWQFLEQFKACNNRRDTNIIRNDRNKPSRISKKERTTGAKRRPNMQPLRFETNTETCVKHEKLHAENYNQCRLCIWLAEKTTSSL